MLAEAATFALADHLGRDAADKLVKDGLARSAANQSNLFDELPKLTDAPVDWAAVRDPANYVGQSDAYIDRVLATAKRGLRD